MTSKLDRTLQQHTVKIGNSGPRFQRQLEITHLKNISGGR
jgi:hypothetical protein